MVVVYDLNIDHLVIRLVRTRVFPEVIVHLLLRMEIYRHTRCDAGSHTLEKGHRDSLSHLQRYRGDIRGRCCPPPRQDRPKRGIGTPPRHPYWTL